MSRTTIVISLFFIFAFSHAMRLDCDEEGCAHVSEVTRTSELTRLAGTTGGNRIARRLPGVCGRRARIISAGGAYHFQEPECCNDRLKGFLEQGWQQLRVKPKLGNVVKFIQNLAQRFFGLSIEVMMSKADFATSTYYNGTVTCKLKLGSHYLYAYATPTQYNIANQTAENFFGSIDSQEPLGGTPAAGFRPFGRFGTVRQGIRQRIGQRRRQFDAFRRPLLNRFG